MNESRENKVTFFKQPKAKKSLNFLPEHQKQTNEWVTFVGRFHNAS